MVALRSSIENSDFYDIKFELRNLSQEDLLNKAAAQSIYIKDLEKRYLEDLNNISDLEEQVKKLQKERYLLLSKNKRLEYSLLSLKD